MESRDFQDLLANTVWTDWQGRAWTTDSTGYPDQRVPALDDDAKGA